MFSLIQRFVLTNKSLILRLFSIAEIGVTLFYLVGLWLFFTQPAWQFTAYGLGRSFGRIALIFYLASLTPGMMQRLRFFPQWATLPMLFRRQLGVMAFLCAWFHGSFTTGVFVIQSGSLAFLNQSQMMGAIALSAFFPLWLTSNDVSKRVLGPKWKLLHKLTYIALLFVLLHLVLMRSSWSLIAGVALVLEVSSWLVLWLRSRSSPSTTSSLPSTPVAKPLSPPVH